MKKTRVIGIIPARYGSKRFPGKLLADLNGKPVIQHTYEQAKKAKMLDYVTVATDSAKIVATIAPFKGNIYVTGKCETGTERVAEAMGMYADIVVNIQGDEPFIRPEVIDDLINELLLHADVQVASVACRLSNNDDIYNRDVVKVDIDKKGYAIGFSRNARHTQYKHIGIYAYRREFLEKFVKMSQTENEIRYSLEQLRILDNGYKIKMITTEYDTISIDIPEDLDKARRYFNGR